MIIYRFYWNANYANYTNHFLDADFADNADSYVLCNPELLSKKINPLNPPNPRLKNLRDLRNLRSI